MSARYGYRRFDGTGDGDEVDAEAVLEALTDDLAARPYQSLEPDELDELMATLEPLATLLLAAQD